MEEKKVRALADADLGYYAIHAVFTIVLKWKFSISYFRKLFHEDYLLLSVFAYNS
jgi:hypothetical protein